MLPADVLRYGVGDEYEPQELGPQVGGDKGQGQLHGGGQQVQHAPQALGRVRLGAGLEVLEPQEGEQAGDCCFPLLAEILRPRSVLAKPRLSWCRSQCYRSPKSYKSASFQTT